MNPKPRRKRDRELLDSIVASECLICSRSPCDPDHITSRGAFGGDEKNNVWPLCRQHHVERHAKGLVYMVQKYIGLRIWLKSAGRQDVLSKSGFAE